MTADPLRSYNFGEINFIECDNETSFSELISLYRAKVKEIFPKVDLFFINIPNFSHMRAALLAAKKSDNPVFVSFKTDDLMLAKAALITSQAIGINFFAADTNDEEILRELYKLSKIPLFKNEITTNKEIIFDIDKEDVSFIFSNDKEIFYLEPDTTEISEPMECSYDMSEEICERYKESYDISLIEINNPDDALDFSKNADLITRPVMFLSHNEISLKMALMLYQGRALIDSSSSIPEDDLDRIAKKYGALIY